VDWDVGMLRRAGRGGRMAQPGGGRPALLQPRDPFLWSWCAGATAETTGAAICCESGARSRRSLLSLRTATKPHSGVSRDLAVERSQIAVLL
jgi:hypothetical protein